MAVRQVPVNEQTKDGCKWILEVRIENKKHKSKKDLIKKEPLAVEEHFLKKRKNRQSIYDDFGGFIRRLL